MGIRLVGRRVSLVLATALLAGLIVAPKAHAQSLQPETNAASLQVWQINIQRLQSNWNGFINRMALNAFKPDLILVQELCRCDSNGDGQNDTNQFLSALNAAMSPTPYAFAHGDPAGSGASVSTYAVFWNSNRLSQHGTPRRWDSMFGSSCTSLGKDDIGIALRDNLQGRLIAAASIHIDPGVDPFCISKNLKKTDQELEALLPNRPMTIVAGDLNQRPDISGVPGIGPFVTPIEESAAQGLETDPDCWYRVFSEAHGNAPTTEPLDGNGCGGYWSSTTDGYYDAVWSYAGSGGGTNPTSTSFCQQFTFNREGGVPVTAHDTWNSCTDANLNGVLDRGRIDYIWVRYEDGSGNKVSHPTPVVASLIEYASADLQVDPLSLTAYSDHRAVQALLRWDSPLL